MKIVKILAVNCVAVCLLMACGNKTVTGADGTVYSNYQDACRNADFNAAYKIIELNDGTEEDKDYVFNSEMLYLVSQNTEDASNRVLYLLAEYQIPGKPITPNTRYRDEDYHSVREYMDGISRYNNRCNNVLNLAISQGNEMLARKVLELFKQNIGIYADDWQGIQFNDYSNEDKDAAKKRLEEAIEQGAFKKSE